MKGKTFSRKVYRYSENQVLHYESMSRAIKSIGKGCIEGLKKAIVANRVYHGFRWSFA